MVAKAAEFTLTVALPAQFEASVQECIDSGRYADTGEVVREALRVLDRRNRLERLRAEIALGLEDSEHGEEIEFTPEFWDRLIREAEDDERNGVPINEAVLP